MKRRRFLGSAGVLAGLATAPLARAAVAVADPPRFFLLVAREAKAGTPFVPLSRAPCADCADSVMEIVVDGLQAGDGLEAFDSLEVRAMFGAGEGSAVPYVAWRYAAGPVPSRTDCARFVAGREALRRLEVVYRVAGDTVRHDESCRIAIGEHARLSPGHYVLAFARRDRSPVDAAGLVHSGDERSPLAGPAAGYFDALSIRVAPVA
ncbi:MAG: hypothetical protein IPJ28_00105 [Betaproteobacteria bacterium]|nr:hypothetical protein [Betaproteobacteria bacterium]